jgi:hypothetical protein
LQKQRTKLAAQQGHSLKKFVSLGFATNENLLVRD